MKENPIGWLGVGLGISSIVLTLFIFYWNHVRVKRNFYFVYVGNISHGLRPQFALVNGGNRDILITSVNFIFEFKEKGAAGYPPQLIEYDESDSMLLASGKAIHGKITFGKEFTSEFASKGDRDGGMGSHFVFPVNADIQWIDVGTGRLIKETVPYMKVGMSESGHLEMWAPAITMTNLYGRRWLAKPLRRV